MKGLCVKTTRKFTLCTKLFFILIVFCTISTKVQDGIKKYVQENTIPITSIESDSTNYCDLAALGEAIGNSKIVMLGEQDHGDAPAFLAKTRLIKYLREKKGVDVFVLVFESDFFGLNYGLVNTIICYDCIVHLKQHQMDKNYNPI